MNKQKGNTLIEMAVGVFIVVVIIIAAVAIMTIIHFVAKFW